MAKASLRGKLLVASPHLEDPNFHRTVVFMVQHDDEGAVGLVLNRPTSAWLEEVWEEIAQDVTEETIRLFSGGPVEGPLMTLHGDPLCREEDETLLEGVFFSLRPENVRFLAQHSAAPTRFFLGYAGWSGGQLEEELESGSWLLSDATSADVFSEPWDLWDRISRRIGLAILQAALGRLERPDDPSCN